MEQELKIVIPFYNAESYIEKCLLSVLTQKYDNFHIILINDASTDKSDEIIQGYLSDKITYIKNETRMGAMYNHQNAVFNFCNPNDIVVQVDGDDMLYNKNVLSYINDVYYLYDCWMMYGQAIYSNGRAGNAKPYLSKEEFENKRNLPFYVSHIRTFRAFAFHEIKNQDENLSCFKDESGNWYDMTCDVAMMYPLMEVCGYERVFYNSKVLYIYNSDNPICDYKIDLEKQERIHKEILNKKPFKQLMYAEGSIK